MLIRIFFSIFEQNEIFYNCFEEEKPPPSLIPGLNYRKNGQQKKKYSQENTKAFSSSSSKGCSSLDSYYLCQILIATINLIYLYLP